jgi:hypothetical protein
MIIASWLQSQQGKGQTTTTTTIPTIIPLVLLFNTATSV